MTSDYMGEARLLRSYRGRSFRMHNCTIVDAALAALMTPGIFEPIPIGEQGREEYFLDASVGCNNPIKVAIREVYEVFGAGAVLGSVVSLGTGKTPA